MASEMPNKRILPIFGTNVGLGVVIAVKLEFDV